MFVGDITELRKDPFDILPEGWICVTHNSGLPIYLHKQLRVVSVSRPYFLGKGSIRVSELPSGGGNFQGEGSVRVSELLSG